MFVQESGHGLWKMSKRNTSELAGSIHATWYEPQRAVIVIFLVGIMFAHRIHITQKFKRSCASWIAFRLIFRSCSGLEGPTARPHPCASLWAVAGLTISFLSVVARLLIMALTYFDLVLWLFWISSLKATLNSLEIMTISKHRLPSFWPFTFSNKSSKSQKVT